MKTLKQVLILIGIAVIAAGVVNLIHPRRIAWVEGWGARAEAIAVSEGVALTQLSELLDYLRAGSHLIVDARSFEEYERGHIPGAFSIPFDENDASVMLRTDRPVVVYCTGPKCEDSVLLALDMVEAGIGNVSVFIGGMELWRAEMLAVEEGDES